jgi:hypothetical protein
VHKKLRVPHSSHLIRFENICSIYRFDATDLKIVWITLRSHNQIGFGSLAFAVLTFRWLNMRGDLYAPSEDLGSKIAMATNQ